MFRRSHNEFTPDPQFEACIKNVGMLSAAEKAAKKIAGTDNLTGLDVVRIIEIGNEVATETTCAARLVLNFQGIYEPDCPRAASDCPHQTFAQGQKGQ